MTTDDVLGLVRQFVLGQPEEAKEASTILADAFAERGDGEVEKALRHGLSMAWCRQGEQLLEEEEINERVHAHPFMTATDRQRAIDVLNEACFYMIEGAPITYTPNIIDAGPYDELIAEIRQHMTPYCVDCHGRNGNCICD
jgi:hypothetical protein